MSLVSLVSWLVSLFFLISTIWYYVANHCFDADRGVDFDAGDTRDAADAIDAVDDLQNTHVYIFFIFCRLLLFLLFTFHNQGKFYKKNLKYLKYFKSKNLNTIETNWGLFVLQSEDEGFTLSLLQKKTNFTASTHHKRNKM